MNKPFKLINILIKFVNFYFTEIWMEYTHLFSYGERETI